MSVSATGSGKTLPFQLLAHTWPAHICLVMILPYQILNPEMKRRMNEIGISCSKWSKDNNPNPTERVVTIPIESLSSTTCSSWLQFLGHSGNLGEIMFDEANGIVEDQKFCDAYSTSVSHLLEITKSILLFCSATMPPNYMADFWKLVKLPFKAQQCALTICSPTHRANIFLSNS